MSIGARLSSARLGVGLSVAEVSARTRLRAGIIENLESDYLTYDAEVFVRAHIKSIANVVGEDYEELVALLNPPTDVDVRTARRSKKSEAAEAGTESHSSTEDDLDIFVVGSREALPPRRSGNLRAIIVGAIALGLVLAGVSFAVSKLTSRSVPSAEPTITESVEPTGDPTEDPTNAAAPTVTVTATDGSHGIVGTGDIVVEIIVDGNSWISVENSAGDVMYEGEVSDGDTFEFRDGDSIKVTVGKAENVKFRANRVYVGRLGSGKQNQTFDETTIPELTGKA